jgi:uncharacterized membrane protein
MTMTSAVLLGAATGGRSMLGLATVAWTGPDNPWVRRLAVLAAVGELVADKLPHVPSRTSPPVLAERIVVAAVAAGVLARRTGRPLTADAVVAATAAVASSVAGVRWRAYAQQRGRSGIGAAVVEDVVCIGLAAAAARGARSPATSTGVPR